jgi:hypothetical protein
VTPQKTLTSSTSLLEPKISQIEGINFESSVGNPVNDDDLHSTVKIALCLRIAIYRKSVYV